MAELMTGYELAALQAKKAAEARTADQDNALVRQKDDILRMANFGLLLEASNTLRFAAPLWRAMSYGYKADEVKRRILDELGHVEGKLHPNAKKERDRIKLARLYLAQI